MKQGNYLLPIYKLSQIDPNSVPRKISYSQWSLYERCPLSWKLNYIDGLAPFQSSIDTVFGTAFHETLQYFLTVMYTESVKKAESLDLQSILTNKLREEYLRCVTETGGNHFSNPLQLAEYLEDGVAILDWFKKRRKQYFSTKNHELVAIEMELCVQASEKNPSVYWYGFIDLVIRNTETNRIYIYDIKTSRSGWNANAKSDSMKMAQLIAYKNYFSKQFGTDVDSIDVEFFIVKRKIVAESMFPQKRVQLVRPSAGSVNRKKVQKQIDAFVEQCFDDAGVKNANGKYLATAGRGAANCKYCFAKTREDLCPKSNRIRE